VKKLLILLFSLLISFSVLSDDISDFEIEGISVGDSLLEYMSKDEILKGIERNKNDYPYLSEPLKYFEVYLFEEFPIYDVVSVYIKNNGLSKYVTSSNEKYTVLGTRGMIYHDEDYDNCIINRDEVVVDGVYFSLSGGGVSEASCFKIEKNLKIEYNWKDFLQVTIYSPEVTNWLRIN
jgi:hypothetical protein